MRLLAIAILACSAFAAENRTPAAHKREAVPVQRTGKAAAAKPDGEIERAFRERLAKSKLASDKISISVRGGVATLEGTTNVIQRKGSATRMAKTAGARQVVNKIRISEEARQKAAANLAKGRRRAQVKRSEVSGR